MKVLHNNSKSRITISESMSFSKQNLEPIGMLTTSISSYSKESENVVLFFEPTTTFFLLENLPMYERIDYFF